MLIGLNISVEILNPDPSIYEDEEASSGIFLSSSILAIIVGRYSYLEMKQKKFKNLYGDKEKDLTIKEHTEEFKGELNCYRQIVGTEEFEKVCPSEFGFAVPTLEPINF